MKYLLLLLTLKFLSCPGFAGEKDSTHYYTIPDSIKAISFLADVNVKAVNTKKEVFAGIKTDDVSLSLESDKNKREIEFVFPKTALVITTGLNINFDEKGALEWNYKWENNQTYRLMISIAADSANNFTLYSGYCWLAPEKKWKLIGTCKISGRWSTIMQVATYHRSIKRDRLDVSFGDAWCQRRNNSWINLSHTTGPTPVIDLYSHADSLQQLQKEIKWIEESIADSKTDVKENVEGVFYKILKEGTGRRVVVSDTLKVYYKGYLFSNGLVFDETKDKPARFPLNRLIKGWQFGLTVCNVGDKIKLVIPSNLAYSIRTRSSRIPPNSILVFEIEVLEAEAAQ